MFSSKYFSTKTQMAEYTSKPVHPAILQPLLLTKNPVFAVTRGKTRLPFLFLETYFTFSALSSLDIVN
ncbi:hypothetical protein NIES4071_109720 (plasmid) [Calothrix sp. NIES-4071]|nr:hypothetical protein NIES4071_109720 [Calothrix sp. NIES-4071]BAZ65220.1 hypothetical protein NIES4105_109530 [Calothrix sp. NIES-4105]